MMLHSKNKLPNGKRLINIETSKANIKRKATSLYENWRQKELKNKSQNFIGCAIAITKLTHIIICTKAVKIAKRLINIDIKRGKKTIRITY